MAKASFKGPALGCTKTLYRRKQPTNIEQSTEKMSTEDPLIVSIEHQGYLGQYTRDKIRNNTSTILNIHWIQSIRECSLFDQYYCNTNKTFPWLKINMRKSFDL